MFAVRRAISTIFLPCSSLGRECPLTSLDRLPALHAVGLEPAEACGAAGHRQAPLTVTLMSGYGAYDVSGTALFQKPCCPQ